MYHITIAKIDYSDDYFRAKSREYTDKYNSLIISLNKIFPDQPYNKEQLEKMTRIAGELYQLVEHSMRMLIRKAFFERYKNGDISEDLWKEISETLHDNMGSGTARARRELDINTKDPERFVIGLSKLFVMMAKFCSPQISYNSYAYQFGRPARVLTLSELNMKTVKNNQNVLLNYAKHDPEDPEDIVDHLDTLQTVVAEIEKYVAIFLADGTPLKKMQFTAAQNEQSLYDLLRQKNRYSKLTRILITDRSDALSEDEQRVFQYLNWDIIVDLDPKSAVSGLESMILPGITPRPVICTPDDVRYRFEPFSDMYWFRFYKNTDTVLTERLISKYVDAFKRFLDGYKGKGGRELFVVSDIRDSSKAYIAVELAKMICDQTYPPEDELPDLSVETDVRFCSLNNQSCYPDNYMGFQPIFMSFDLTMHQLLEKMAGDLPMDLTDTRRVYIDSNGHMKTLETAAYRCFDIIYAGIEQLQELSNDEDVLDPKGFFLARSPISWYAIDHGQHLITSTLNTIISKLGEVNGGIIRSDYLLPYDPGVGGTTALRTLAYRMSKKMPAILLKQYVEKETWKECKALSKETNCAVFIAVDENLLSLDEYRDLCDTLSQYHVPHIAVYAMRDTRTQTQKLPFKKLERLSGLNHIETKLMAQRLKKMVEEDSTYSPEEKAERIDRIERTLKGEKFNYPFIMCMYAFEKEFKGTKDYIRHFLAGRYDLTERQKEILLWIAIISVHSSCSLDTGLFAAGRTFFPGSANDVADHLLRFEDQRGQKKVRFLHPLLAGEVIRQILFPGKVSYTIGDLHKALCEALRKLIEYIMGTGAACSLTLKVNTLKELFILKEPFDYEHQTAALSPLMNELYQGVFDQLDYQGDFGVVDNAQRIYELRRIMQTLVECCPDEPHFHAHYGRFLAYMDNQVDRYELALEQADKAIDLEADDCLLYHIRANCRRSMLREKIRGYLDGMEYHREVSPEELKQCEVEILELAKRASEDFELSRRNENAAGFLCDVRMCIDLVDFCKTAHNTDYQTIASAEQKTRPDIAPYSEYYCRAMELFKEIDEIDQISERKILRVDVQKVKGQILAIQNELGDALGFWERYISKTADPLDRYRAIRFCINSQRQNDAFDHIQNQATFEKLIKYSEILLEQTDSISAGDLAQWFTLKINYSRFLSGSQDRIMLEDMMMNLTRWQDSVKKESSKKLISMLRFIVACIQVLQGDSRAVAVVSKQTAAGNFSPKYYLRKGERSFPILGDLYRYKENEAKNHYQRITGELTRFQDDAYRIDAQGIPVYCSMQRQEHIRESDLHQTVEFGMLFTLNDARALFDTVKLNNRRRINMQHLSIGSIVTCEVIEISQDRNYDDVHYAFVSFNDAIEIYGVLKISEDGEVPKVGEVLQLTITGEPRQCRIRKLGGKTNCWIMGR